MKKKSIFSSLLVLLIVGCGIDSDLFEELVESATKVQLIFPENNSECTAGVIISENESEVVFDWSDAEVVDSYLIQLTNLSDGQLQTFSADSSFFPIRLQRGTPYQWSVTTIINEIDETIESDIEFFYNSGPGVTTFVPFPATAITPANEALLISSTTVTTIEWSAEDLDNDIVNYDLYFGASNPPEILSSELETSSLSNVQVMSGTRYYWQVVTRDDLGNESNSEIFSFEVSD